MTCTTHLAFVTPTFRLRYACHTHLPHIEVKMTIDEMFVDKMGEMPVDKMIVYEESVVDKFKSNLLLVIFWLNIIDYNS
jgi:hypothetical protein